MILLPGAIFFIINSSPDYGENNFLSGIYPIHDLLINLTVAASFKKSVNYKINF